MAEFLERGTKAPDFEGRDQDGNLVRLSGFAGRPVVLYFYPADETFGCTREACAFRDEFDDFRKAEAVVLGVSPQGESSHRAFRDRHGLNFPLLADPERTVIKAYRAAGLLGLTKRVTYVIGPDGTILDVVHPPDPKRHSREALRVLEEHRGHGATEPSPSAR
jgi:thioredoxin-dependent peroxiredoxin